DVKRRVLEEGLLAVGERTVRELEEAPTVDLDKLGQALDLWRMARLAAMRRTQRRVEAAMWGEPMRPVSELGAEGVDLHPARRAAVEDFLQNRPKPREEDKPPRSRGQSTPKYLREARRQARMLEREGGGGLGEGDNRRPWGRTRWRIALRCGAGGQTPAIPAWI